MGRKKKSAAKRDVELGREVDELMRQMLESIDAKSVESAKREGEAARVASRVAVKWAHSRFAASAGALAAVVDGVYRGDDSLTPEDVGECLTETTRRLKRLKAVTDNADAVFAELDELGELLGGRVVGLDK